MEPTQFPWRWRKVLVEVGEVEPLLLVFAPCTGLLNLAEVCLSCRLMGLGVTCLLYCVGGMLPRDLVCEGG